jgi:hypothetical protein
VWAVLDGAGAVRVRDRVSGVEARIVVDAPGAYPLVEHARHTAGTIELELDGAVRCVATCFTPGVA